MLKTVTNIVDTSQIIGVLPVVKGGTGSTTSTGSGSVVLATAPIIAGNLSLSTGNLVVANSQGIDFSATPGTGTSELFADYEEGEFTPSLTVASGSLTFSNQGSRYTKSGRLVNAGGYINVSVTNLPSGNLTITGLPFTNTNYYTAVTLTLFAGGFTTNYSGYLSLNGTSITVPNLNANIMVGGENIMFSATYSAT